jgi:hypothetical protein
MSADRSDLSRRVFVLAHKYGYSSRPIRSGSDNTSISSRHGTGCRSTVNTAKPIRVTA